MILALGRLSGLPESVRKEKKSLFTPPYSRPSLELFNKHCDQVIETFNLDTLHVQARAIKCSIGENKVRVGLSNGSEFEANKVILALGSSEHPNWPSWASPNSPYIHHIFDPGFEGWPPSRETVVVVGGGISAAQVALRLINEGQHVHMISPHPLREHQFDSDPGWLGPKNMTNFSREQDLERRRGLITEARHKGSIPREVWIKINKSIIAGKLQWHDGEVLGVSERSDVLRLLLSSGSVIDVNRVLLATGFCSECPGGELVDQLSQSASLPRAKCGYPVVDKALRWHPRVFVTGPLAELELGPASRNISGARRAGDRIISLGAEAS